MKLLHEDWIEPGREFHLAFYRNYVDAHGPAHTHDFHEIMFTQGGTFTHHVNGRSIIVPAGSLIWIRPDDDHSFGPMTGEETGFYNLAYLSEIQHQITGFLGGAESTVARLSLQELPPAVLLAPDEQRKLMLRLNKLALTGNEPPAVWRAEARSLLAWIMGEFFSEQGIASDRADLPSWLAALCESMTEMRHFSAGTRRMSELSSRSPEHLARTFQRYFGQTPTQWLHQIRIRYAAHMLSCSNRPILEIMLDCGYENTSHFYRLFKERYQCSPAKFRSLYPAAPVPEI